MYIKGYYIDEILKLYKEKFKKDVRYDDDNGKYFLDEVGIVINRWNGKILPMELSLSETICCVKGYKFDNLISFILQFESYWFQESDTEQGEENE